MALRLIKQLDNSTYSRSNCGCVATAHAIAWSTDNKVQRTPKQIRRSLGGVWTGPGNATALKDQKRAWEALRKPARRRGLSLPEFKIRPTEPWHSVIDALKAGNAVMLQIDNLTLNTKAIDKSGFPDFDGLHVVLITAIRGKGANRELLDYDGGYDGRVDRETKITVPRGPQWVREDVLKAAAEQKNVRTWKEKYELSQKEAEDKSLGTATFAIIEPATPIDVGGGGGKGGEQPGPVVDPDPVDPDPGEDPDPDPVVPDPAEASIEELRAAHKRLRRRIARLEAENDDLANENATLAGALDVIQGLLAQATPGDQAVAAATAEIEATLPPPPVDDTLDIGVGDEL